VGASCLKGVGGTVFGCRQMGSKGRSKVVDCGRLAGAWGDMTLAGRALCGRSYDSSVPACQASQRAFASSSRGWVAGGLHWNRGVAPSVEWAGPDSEGTPKLNAIATTAVRAPAQGPFGGPAWHHGHEMVAVGRMAS
jgi:hypothetical protein